VGARCLGGMAPDGGARRWPVATAAMWCSSCDGAQCRANKRRRTLLGFPEDVLEAWVCDGDSRRRRCSSGGVGGTVGGSFGVRRGKALGFYRGGLTGDVAVTAEIPP
jgi:hypothetical protein